MEPMTTHGVLGRSPLFSLASSVSVDAAAADVYRLVSSLEKSSIWSPECRGGTWTGRPGEVGSVFRGENYRAEEVVGWAPLVRGTWFTDAVVLTAEPGVLFEWAMLTHAKMVQSSVWGFAIEAIDAGSSVLTHRFTMEHATEGIHHIVADLDEAGRERFVDEWSDKLRADVAVTLGRIKDHLERDAAASAPVEATARAGR